MLVVGHLVQTVRGLPPPRLTHAETKTPHHRIAAIHGGAEIDDAHRKVGTHGLVDLRQRDRRHFRNDLAQLAGQIPAHAEIAQESADGIERAPLVISPDIDVAGLVELLLHRRSKEVVSPGVMLVKLRMRVSPLLAGDLVPRRLHLPAGNVVIAPRPGLDGREIRVVADKDQPVLPGHNPIRAILQTSCRDPELLRVNALADVDPDRHVGRRLRTDQ